MTTERKFFNKLALAFAVKIVFLIGLFFLIRDNVRLIDTQSMADQLTSSPPVKGPPK